MNKFRNESTTDRITRIVFGAALLIIAYNWLDGAIAIIAYVLAVILLVTGSTGFCTLYKVFGINTYHEKRKEIKKIISN